jgi:hypothetical protein
MGDMATQWEQRIAHLEQELKKLEEARALAQGLCLALDEAQKQIAELSRQVAELSRLHICEMPKKKRK